MLEPHKNNINVHLSLGPPGTVLSQPDSQAYPLHNTDSDLEQFHSDV